MNADTLVPARQSALRDFCMLGMICKTQRAAERVRESITKFIEGKLFLKVNKEKTVVVYMEVLETSQDPNKEPHEMWNQKV